RHIPDVFAGIETFRPALKVHVLVNAYAAAMRPVLSVRADSRSVRGDSQRDDAVIPRTERVRERNFSEIHRVGIELDRISLEIRPVKQHDASPSVHMDG